MEGGELRRKRETRWQKSENEMREREKEKGERGGP
jgi:hypothetical protein